MGLWARGPWFELQEVTVDKISGILPSSARVTSVDMKESGSVRPGTVSFGRPEGVSGRKEKAMVDGMHSGAEAHEVLSERRSKDAQQAELVKGITDRFFTKNKPEPAAVAVSEEPQPVLVEPRAMRSQKVFEKPEEELDEGPAAVLRNAPSVGELYPRGSFVNRMA
jgi:hypothetical protein